MVKYSHTYNPYSTHQPVLIEAIKYNNENARLPILELGSGFGSTELIHEVADLLEPSINITTIDNNKEWLDNFKHLESAKHKLVLVNSLEDILRDFRGGYGVIFVDQGDWVSRADCIKYYNPHADLVVLHDSDYLERELNLKFEDWYKYVKTFMPLEPYPYFTGPPTTIMSNWVDVTNWDLDYRLYV